ncbi:hypothetical protein KAR10_03020 [bacterium]|nr:hypothetical protein [bacterium]
MLEKTAKERKVLILLSPESMNIVRAVERDNLLKKILSIIIRKSWRFNPALESVKREYPRLQYLFYTN